MVSAGAMWSRRSMCPKSQLSRKLRRSSILQFVSPKTFGGDHPGFFDWTRHGLPHAAWRTLQWVGPWQEDLHPVDQHFMEIGSFCSWTRLEDLPGPTTILWRWVAFDPNRSPRLSAWLHSSSNLRRGCSRRALWSRWAMWHPNRCQ